MGEQVTLLGCLGGSGGSIEVLAAISGRAWEALNEPTRLNAFMPRLADNDHGQAAFEHCLGDLLSLPELRDRLRATLRSPALCSGVSGAFAIMTAKHVGDGVD